MLIEFNNKLHFILAFLAGCKIGDILIFIIKKSYTIYTELKKEKSHDDQR
jgi:hypothetical protein